MKKSIVIAHLVCLVLGWISSSLISLAGPARPGTFTVMQKDGTRIKVAVHGDEFYNYVTTEDGYTLTDAGDGNWYFARQGADGQLVSTGIKARPAGTLTPAERSCIHRGLRPEGMTAFQARLRMAMRTGHTAVPYSADGLSAPPMLNGTAWKAEGSKKMLVILAAFKDVPFTKGSKAAFESMLNSPDYTLNGATGSAAKYYSDNSGGKFTPEFVVAGPYTLSGNQAAYKDNAEGMAKEAAQLADKDIDFSEFAENGNARDIFVFYSGGAKSDAAPDAIWPHKCSFRTPLTLDGTSLNGYACSSELEVTTDGGSSGLASIGSFCHEFGHIIGWPDFYDTDSSDGSDGDGPRFFSLMDYGCYNNNGCTPPALGILERWMAGWSEPEIISADGKKTLTSISDGKGYLIKTGQDNDYFLLECRGTDKTVWDSKEYLDYFGTGPFWGMVVGHIDASWTGNWKENCTNNIAGQEGYTLLHSDSQQKYTYGPSYYPSQCFFPGGNGVTSIRSSASTGFISRSGKRAALEITLIEPDESGKTVTLTLAEPGSEISGIDVECFQHDALISWKDELSGSWTLDWKTESGNMEPETLTVTTPNAHIQALEAGKVYELGIKGDRSARQTVKIQTAESGSGMPRIVTSRQTFTSKDMVLLMLADCKDFTDILWTVDGAHLESSYIQLKKGEHYIQAEITLADGSKEYFARYIKIIM